MMIWSRISVLAGVLLFLAACNTTSGLERNVHNPMSFLTYAANNQDMKTIVIGNPTKASDVELQKFITGTLQKNYSYLDTNFTTRDTDQVVQP